MPYMIIYLTWLTLYILPEYVKQCISYQNTHLICLVIYVSENNQPACAQVNKMTHEIFPS